jgi:hypothetical protein
MGEPSTAAGEREGAGDNSEPDLMLHVDRDLERKLGRETPKFCVFRWNRVEVKNIQK